MLRPALICLLLCVTQFIFAQDEMALAKTIVESLHTKNFELLKPYLITEEAARKLSPDELAGKSSKELNAFLAQSIERLKEGWKEIGGNAKNAKIDLSKVVIREVVIEKIPNDGEVLGLRAGYDYKGRSYEDFLLIVALVEGKYYLLEFPATMTMLTLEVRERSQLDEAKLKNAVQDSTFRRELKDRVVELMRLARANKLKEFAELCVYTDEADDKRRWKDKVNVNSPDEMKWPTQVAEKLVVETPPAKCTEWFFEDIYSERESEGLWVIVPMSCPGYLKLEFAFLKVGDEMLLGDVDHSRP